LPRHRGAAPIEGAILAGDAETGVTIMRIVEQMDAGPAYLQRAIPIASDDTQGSLKEKLAELGASAILEAIDLAIRGALVETAQDEALATYTSIVKKQDAVIDWPSSAVQSGRLKQADQTRRDGGRLLRIQTGAATRWGRA
jgi:methionyl-tRNA formyltransferase